MGAARDNLSRDYLRSILDYDPATGHFKWLVKRNSFRGKIDIGALAGCLAGGKTGGYILIGIDGRIYRAHRLAWLYMTGEWPKDQIDHRNHDRADNRWANLREATLTENNRNVPTYGSTGFKGVFLDKKSPGKYFAQINHDHKSIYLGRYVTAEEAHAAYLKKAAELHGDFASA